MLNWKQMQAANRMLTGALAALFIFTAGLLARQISAQVPSQILVGSSGAPTISACGASPSMDANATDSSGQITTGTGLLTSCKINFSQTMPRAPNCVATLMGTGAVLGVSGVTTNDLTIGLSLSLPGTKFMYICHVN